MIETGDGSSLVRWTTAGCPFVIEYDKTAVDDIRLAVVDAFFSLPRGGAEIGGILLGEYAPGKLSITGYQQLDCEHANGPGFTLSPNDHAKLAELIRSTPGGGKDVVGWYHSHTRSELMLTDADLAVHNRYFREPWHVAMVMKPSTFKPTRVGFFFRDSTGTIRTESSDEFDLVPQLATQLPSPESAAERRRERPSARRTTPEPEPEVQVPPRRRHGLTLDAVLRNVESAPAPPATPDVPTQPLPEGVKQAPEEPAAQPVLDEAVQPAEAAGRVRARTFGGLYWLLVASLVGVLVYQTREYWMGSQNRQTMKEPVPAADLSAQGVPTDRPPVPPTRSVLLLAVNDAAGHLQIRWDAAAQVVQNAAGGSIEISDGENKAVVPLDQSRLRAGSFTYVRSSQSVDIRLLVDDAKGTRIQEAVSFFGKLPEHPATGQEVIKQRDQLQQEAARLKAALATQTERASKLERQLEDARKQLRRDQQRRRLENQVTR